MHSEPLRCALLLIGLGGSMGCSAEEQAPHVILVTLDTTRADALGVYGGPQGLTPHLDRLAQESLVFTEARTVAPLTLPAHASMFTGLYPPRHGVRGNGPMFLPSSASTLAEAARDAGYETAAFVSSLALDKDFRLNQGFENYDQPGSEAQDSSLMNKQRADATTVQRALTWLDSRPADRPFFLWVHLFDPHAPYVPQKEFAERAPGDPYLGEVAAMDAAFGTLREGLNGMRDARRQILAVVGDHGEGRMEHDEPTHALLCYDSTLRVPMLLHDSATDQGGTQVTQLSSVVDVYPTLLASMGLPQVAGIDGHDLLSKEPGNRAGIYFESNYGYRSYGWSPLAGWMDEGRKYIHSSKPELYSRSGDVNEEHNLLDESGAEALSYRNSIAALFNLPKLAADRHSAVSEELYTSLNALGYTSSASPQVEFLHPLESTNRFAPQDRMAEAQACNQAWSALAKGQPAEAVILFEGVLSGNPANSWAMSKFAQALMEIREWERALEVLRDRLKLAPDLVDTHQRIAQCLSATGGSQELIREHLRRAMWLTAEAYDARGQGAAAEKYRGMYKKALEQSLAKPRAQGSD